MARRQHKEINKILAEDGFVAGINGTNLLITGMTDIETAEYQDEGQYFYQHIYR